MSVSDVAQDFEFEALSSFRSVRVRGLSASNHQLDLLWSPEDEGSREYGWSGLLTNIDARGDFSWLPVLGGALTARVTRQIPGASNFECVLEFDELPAPFLVPSVIVTREEVVGANTTEFLTPLFATQLFRTVAVSVAAGQNGRVRLTLNPIAAGNSIEVVTFADGATVQGSIGIEGRMGRLTIQNQDALLSGTYQVAARLLP